MAKSPAPSSSFPRLLLGWVVLNLVLAALWLASALYAFSNVDTSWPAYLLLPAGIAIALSWLVQSSLVLGRRLMGRRDRFTTMVRLAWALVPIFGAIGAVCFVSDWDLRLRLALSENALISQADAMRRSSTEYHAEPGWIGLFYVEEVRVLEGGAVRFITQYPGIFDEAGLYYAPAPEVRPLVLGGRAEEVHRLTGPWWTCYYAD